MGNKGKNMPELLLFSLLYITAFCVSQSNLNLLVIELGFVDYYIFRATFFFLCFVRLLTFMQCLICYLFPHDFCLVSQ
jgi:hypothetical protein